LSTRKLEHDSHPAKLDIHSSIRQRHSECAACCRKAIMVGNLLWKLNYGHDERKWACTVDNRGRTKVCATAHTRTVTTIQTRGSRDFQPHEQQVTDSPGRVTADDREFHGARICKGPNKFEIFEERCHQIKFTESHGHLRLITGQFILSKNLFCQIF